jgi:hypothetical protein
MATQPKTFTWAEIQPKLPAKSSNTTPSLEQVLADPSTPYYIVINNKVYNVGGDFVKWHPGGAVVLSQVSFFWKLLLLSHFVWVVGYGPG